MKVLLKNATRNGLRGSITTEGWSLPPQRVWLSLPELIHVSVHTYFFFFLKKHFTCFTAFCLYVEIIFYTADRPGPCYWSLPGDLVARI